MTKITEDVTFKGTMEKQDNGVITLKELYTELIATKTRLEDMRYRNRRTDGKFTVFAVVVVGLEAINMLFNYFLYLR